MLRMNDARRGTVGGVLRRCRARAATRRAVDDDADVERRRDECERATLARRAHCNADRVRLHRHALIIIILFFFKKKTNKSYFLNCILQIIPKFVYFCLVRLCELAYALSC